MDLNQSSYFVQQLTEDGSLDYSVDWDGFCFKDELNTRNKLINEHLHAFRLCAQSTAAVVDDDHLIIQTQENRDINCELLKDNELMLSKYDVLVNELRGIKEEVNNLTLTNSSLEMSIKKREEDETTLRKEYQLQKVALQKAIEMYSTHFDLDVDVKNISDSIYEASIKFGKGSDSPPIKFAVDRINRTVIDFKNGLLTSAQEENIRKQFGDLQNLPGLLCALCDIILSKQS